jgi:asparagine synthetase B (glutamine-hydrolysing)
MKKIIVIGLLSFLWSIVIAQAPNSSTTNQQLLIPSFFKLKKPFVIQNIEEFPDNELFIFDKQGNLVYHTEYYDNKWEGKKEDGTEVLEDELFYYIFDDGRGNVLSGYIQVIGS